MSKDIVYSPEQVDIIKHIMNSSENLKVLAYAGASKTFTLFESFRHAKSAGSNKKFLLLSFNKHLQKEYIELKKKYALDNLEVATFNAYSLKLVKMNGIEIDGTLYDFPDKIINNIHPYKLHEINDNNYINQWSLAKSFNKMLKSSDADYGNYSDLMCKLLEEGIMTHNMYMKIFTVNSSKYNSPYDAVIIDEVQDISEQFSTLLLDMNVKQKIIVGDIYQSLYGFLNGSYNLLEDVRTSTGFRELTLAKSFRCNPTIAKAVYDTLMYPYQHAEMEFKGYEDTLPDNTTLYCTTTNSQVLFESYALARAKQRYVWRAKYSDITRPMLDILHVLKYSGYYTECKSVSEMMKNIPESFGKDIIQRDVSIDLLHDIMSFRKESRDEKDKGLYSYLEKNSNEASAALGLLRSISHAGMTVSNFLKPIREFLDTKSDNPAITIANVHKTKGSTFGTVFLKGFDSPEAYLKDAITEFYSKVERKPVPRNITLEAMRIIAKDNRDEKMFIDYRQNINCLYVAITRARHHVEVVDNGKWFTDYYNRLEEENNG